MTPRNAYEADAATIPGHPSVVAVNDAGRALQITVCENCESLRSVLFLSKDRWYCHKCRTSGEARPTVIPLARPGRR